MRTKIEKYLIELGFSPEYKGFTYWADAIELVIDNTDIKMGDMYKIVSDKHKVNEPRRVERNFRNAYLMANGSKIKECCNGYNIKPHSVLRWIAFRIIGEMRDEEN